MEEVKKPLSTEFVFQPKNFTELYEKINSSEINYSEIFNDQKRKDIESTSLKNFNFPRKNSAFKTVGNEVLKFIEKKKKSSLQKFFLYFKILIINLKQIKASNFLFKYSFVMSDKSYNPLKISNNLKVNKFVKLIINELNN